MAQGKRGRQNDRGGRGELFLVALLPVQTPSLSCLATGHSRKTALLKSLLVVHESLIMI